MQAVLTGIWKNMRFEPTINWGHLSIIFTVAAQAIIFWSATEKRLALIERDVAEHNLILRGHSDALLKISENLARFSAILELERHK